MSLLSVTKVCKVKYVIYHMQIKVRIGNIAKCAYNHKMYRLRIKEEAEKRGYNQSSLSRASDISLVTIRKIWKNPYYEINIVTLHKIAQTLGVPTSTLIEDVDE